MSDLLPPHHPNARRYSKARACLLLSLCAMVFGITRAGAQWQEVKSPASNGALLYGVDIPTDSAIYCIGYGTQGFPIIYKSADAGASWHGISIPGMLLFDMKFVSATTGFVAGQEAGCQCPVVSKTTDGGAHWAFDTILNAKGGIDQIAPGAGMSSFYFENPDTGYVVGVGGLIAKTTDGGTTWHTTSTGTTVDFFTNISVPAPGYAYAIAAAPENPNTVNQFYRSTDNGEHWTKAPLLEYNASFPGITFLTPETGFLPGVDSTAVIFKTTDGGTTWARKYSGDTSVAIYTTVFRNSKEGFAVGTSGTILHTVDGGDHWTPERDLDTSVFLSDVALTSDMVYAVGPSGIFRRPLSQASVDGAAHPTDGDIIIAPNPVSDYAVIRPANLIPGADYRFTLYDILGREIRRTEGTLGKDGIAFSRQNLSPGTYLYKLSSNNTAVGSGTVVVR